jgi:hypothetical protein
LIKFTETEVSVLYRSVSVFRFSVSVIDKTETEIPKLNFGRH